jgi:hypothetical protein
MRLRPICVLLIVAGLSGCASRTATSSNPTPTPTVTKHTYNGTASVGDFLTITVDTTALTISYTNLSNGDSGTVPYTVNANGSYAIADPDGNLISAYEVPGYALVIQVAKAGPSHNTPALVTAVESGSISLTTFANESYNYMQFRTSFGGLDVGSVSIGATSGQTSSYWPYGNISGGGAFNSSTLDFSGLQEDASGTYISGAVGGAGSGTDYIFGTASGFFIVDSPNGSILGLQKAASAEFDSSVAGTYSAVFYQKLNANNNGSVETGTPSTGEATIVITAAAGITVTDSQGNTLINATLTPVSSASYLYGPGGLTDPCNGLFTFRATTATYQHDVFVTFIGNSVVFSKFSANLPWSADNGTYSYLYGVGLK